VAIAFDRQLRNDQTGAPLGAVRPGPVDRRSRPRTLTIFFINGGSVEIPNVTSVQLRDYSSGELNLACRSGNLDVAAFNGSQIVGWAFQNVEPDDGVDTTAERSRNPETELDRVRAIREAVGDGIGSFLVDDETRYARGCELVSAPREK